MTAENRPFSSYLKRARDYGIGDFLEIVSEMSQESTRRGALDRKTKELITLGVATFKRCNRCIGIHNAEAAKLGASAAELTQVRKTVLFMEATPHGHAALWETWTDSWREFALGRGPLSRGTRELVALAIGIVRQHEASIALHVAGALEFGMTPEQVFEVIPVTLLMDGAPALSQIPRVVDALERTRHAEAASA